MSRAVTALALCGLLSCTHAEKASPKVTPPDAPAPAGEPTPQPPGPKVRPGEEILKTRPTLPELRPFDAPVPKLTVLPNGLKLYVVERQGGGIEALRFVVRRGSAADPPGRPGVASLTGAMLEAGSAGKTQEQVAAAIKALGADLTVFSTEDSTSVFISGMTSRLEPMVSLLADVALRPNFERAEFERLKSQREAELIAERSQPVSAASMAWFAATYGSHPFGDPPEGTVASVKKMTLDQLKAFFQTFSPQEAAIVAVGGAPEAEVVAALTRAFGGWRSTKGSAPGAKDLLARAKLEARRPRLVVVDFPGRPQSVLRVGQPAVPRSTPDFLALRLLNSVLGGSFTSRLVQNLRERHGYTYGASSGFSFGAGPGPFIAQTSVKTEVTGPALKELMHELERAVAEPLSQAELEKGKALLAFDLIQAFQHASSAALALGDLFLYDLPLDEFRTHVPRLRALTAEQVQAAARRVLTPGSMTITVVGDASKIESQLQAEAALALPPAQRRDATGGLVPGSSRGAP